MDRSTCDGSSGRNHNLPEDGAHDSTLLPQLVNITDQQQQQQEASSRENVFGWELQRFILSRVGVNGIQKMAYKLRLINKSGKERVEKGIKEAKISILNIHDLATSQLSSRIQNLEVFVIGLLGLQNLPFLSPVHFMSIKSINLIITGTFDFEPWNRECFQLPISEPLILKNINITNKSNLQELGIKGKYEVVIQDCTFNGLSIGCFANAQVSVVNSRFINTVQHGFHCFGCDSLLMDQITIKDCGWSGCYVIYCGNVSIDNIEVVSSYSSKRHGITFRRVNGFKLHNAFVQDCGQSGIDVDYKSVGEIQKTCVQGCQDYGILVWNESIVRYAQIKCDNNQRGEFYVQGGSEFLQMN